MINLAIPASDKLFLCVLIPTSPSLISNCAAMEAQAVEIQLMLTRESHLVVRSGS